MYTQILRLALIVAAFLIAVPASAQHFSQGSDEQLGFNFFSPDNCGRRISQQQAEGVWGGYCNESCAFESSGNTGHGKKCGSGCALRNKLHGGSGFGGCNSGCFGYSDGGCGASYIDVGFQNDDCGTPRHSGCKAKAGHGGCKSRQFGGHHGSRHGGCKAKSGHGGCKLFGGCSKFKRSAQECGSNGAYFQEAVGFDYGTSGMQSCVSCNTCGSFDELVGAADAQSVIGGFNQAPVELSAPISQGCCN